MKWVYIYCVLWLCLCININCQINIRKNESELGKRCHDYCYREAIHHLQQGSGSEKIINTGFQNMEDESNLIIKTYQGVRGGMRHAYHCYGKERKTCSQEYSCGGYLNLACFDQEVCRSCLMCYYPSSCYDKCMDPSKYSTILQGKSDLESIFNQSFQIRCIRNLEIYQETIHY